MKNNIADIFGKYRKQLLAFIRDRVPEDEDAEDILQDVFLRLLQTEETTSVLQISGWLYRVARNRIIDRHRKQQEERMPRTVVQQDGSVFMREITDILSDEDRSPDREYVRSLVWEQLEKSLDELPASQKNVFIQTELDGKTFKQLSEESGVRIETLLSRKYYATQHLRRRLKEVYEILLDET